MMAVESKVESDSQAGNLGQAEVSWRDPGHES